MSKQIKISGLNDIEIYNKITSIDLSLIHSRLIENLDWSKEQCKKIEEEYKAFIFLCYSFPNKPIVPTYEIDEMWHNHILDTRKYAEDCEKTIGYFLHHFPYFGRRGINDNNNWKEAFIETKNLFKKHFNIDLEFKFGSGILDEENKAAMCYGGGCADKYVA